MRRNYYSGDVAHIYQRSLNGNIIFYTEFDFIVYFTMLSVISRKMGVKVLAVTIMLNHIHLLISAGSQEIISGMMRDLNSKFTKEYNRNCGTKGPIWDTPFGQSNKYGSKSIRTAIAYVYNNYVEKKAVSKAEEARWSFLPYYCSKSPFSKWIPLRTSSNKFRLTVKEMNSIYKKGDVLNYAELNRWQSNLTEGEWDSLIDRIISQYLCIDFKECVKYYGSYEKMITAIDSNSGSEYEIKEEYEGDSYTGYSKMKAWASSVFGLDISKNILHLNIQQFRRYESYLLNQRIASTYQIFHYFHIHPCNVNH